MKQDAGVLAAFLFIFLTLFGKEGKRGGKNEEFKNKSSGCIVSLWNVTLGN